MNSSEVDNNADPIEETVHSVISDIINAISMSSPNEYSTDPAPDPSYQDLSHYEMEDTMNSELYYSCLTEEPEPESQSCRELDETVIGVEASSDRSSPEVSVSPNNEVIHHSLIESTLLL